MSASYEHQGNNQITIVDIDVPMSRMVIIILKWMLASIPAMIVLYVAMAIIMFIFMALFGGLAMLGGAAAAG